MESLTQNFDPLQNAEPDKPTEPETSAFAPETGTEAVAESDSVSASATINSMVKSQIDPQNPFENPMENSAYNSDYRMVVPQIAIPGCELPLKPNRYEKKRIRHFFNTAGLCAFLSFAISNVLMTVLMLIILTLLEGNILDGWKAFNHGGGSYDFFQSSAAMVAMVGISYFTTNVLITAIGCKATGIKPVDLFSTTNFKAIHAASYILIAFFIQNLTGQASSLVSYLMDKGGMVMYEAEMGSYSGATMLTAQFLYGCLLAPVGEELLFRGVVMKNLSRVSQRFGIFMSAALFGLAHQNIAQFLLAFFLGIFLGEIDTRHNSLMPSILVHVAVNVMATGLSMIMELEMPDIGVMLINLGYFAIVVSGLIFFILDRNRYHLPYNMPKQSMRTGSIALTSPWLLIACACHLGMTIYYIVLSTMGVLS